MATPRILELDKGNIEIDQLPSSWNDPQHLKETVARFRDFRLFALRTAPDSFSTIYEQAMEFTEEWWSQRLQNEDVVQFIAATSDETEGAYKHPEWVGMVALVRKESGGPKSDLSPSKNSGINGDSQDNITSEHLHPIVYHINGLFVHPSYRGAGLGKCLTQRCLDFAQVEAKERGYSEVRVAALVDSRNSVAINLYQSQGFSRTGECENIAGGSVRLAISMEQIISIV